MGRYLGWGLGKPLSHTPSGCSSTVSSRVFLRYRNSTTKYFGSGGVRVTKKSEETNGGGTAPPLLFRDAPPPRFILQNKTRNGGTKEIIKGVRRSKNSGEGT